MSLPHPTNLGRFFSSRSAYNNNTFSEVGKLDYETRSVKKSDTGIPLYDNRSKERIKKMFKKTDISISSYDTAWMAMVPSTVNPHTTPQFPSCLNWVLNNQLSDGSWGLCNRDATLTMDAISSTLACVLALKQWGTGERQINLGLEFIGLNSAFVNGDKQRKPIGFDIVFPAMIEQANSLNLNVPINQGDLDALFKKRNLELASSSVDFPEGRRAYLSYVSEGVGIYQDWEMAMKYQRTNGSLLNSPSATAAAFSHLHDPDCLRYLNRLLDRFGDAAPAVYYPLAIHTRLWMIDNLETLGIHHHFKEEIEAVLEETYRGWLQGEEEIFQDTTTCAMAFRILRWHGYDVSSDALRQFVNVDRYRSTLEGYLGKTGPVLELYKASQMAIYEDEVILDEINSWSSHFLTGRLQNPGEGFLDKHLNKEVDHALRFPYHSDLEWLANKRNIENYQYLDNTRILKSAVRYDSIGNKDFFNLAVEDFNKCQLIHQKEMKDLQRWIVEERLDKLKFARQEQLAACYLTAAASLPNPELSEVRMSWAKHAALATVIDDFFDYGGSEEEHESFMQLSTNKLEDNIIGSNKVEILYSALKSLICETSDKAFGRQGRCLMDHATETWLNMFNSMLKEAEWSREKLVPTMSEYMANGCISLALGPIVLLPLFSVGPQLSQAAIQGSQLQNLYELVSTCGRLLNDVQSFKREMEEGKLTVVALEMIRSGSDEEEAIKALKGVIRSKTRELLRYVLLEEEDGVNVIPRECRDLFWKMNAVLHLVYMEEDGFTSRKFMNDVKTLFQQPISPDHSRL